jgi:glucokinase
MKNNHNEKTKNIVLGVDIGGSHITTQLIDLDLKTGLEHSWSRTKVDSSAGVEHIIDAWAKTIEQTTHGLDYFPERINIALPGPMDYERGISHIQNQGKYESLYGLNVKELLASRLDIDPAQIKLVNDAACFLKGELFSGSLSDVDRAIGLTLGTGLGTSHTARGTALDSDLWKMPFNKGIAEDYISTRWFVTRFHQLAGISIKDVQDLVENHQKSPYFNAVFLEFSINLAKFLFRFIRRKKPAAVVIGGNIALAERFFLEDTRKFLSKKLGYDFPVRRSSLGEKATLIGAGAS